MVNGTLWLAWGRRGLAAAALAVAGPLAVVLAFPSGRPRLLAAALVLLAVLGAAALGRLAPGLLAVATGTIAIDWRFLPPRDRFGISSGRDMVTLVVLVVLGTALAAVVSD